METDKVKWDRVVYTIYSLFVFLEPECIVGRYSAVAGLMIHNYSTCKYFQAKTKNKTCEHLFFSLVRQCK